MKQLCIIGLLICECCFAQTEGGFVRRNKNLNNTQKNNSERKTVKQNVTRNTIIFQDHSGFS